MFPLVQAAVAGFDDEGISPPAARLTATISVSGERGHFSERGQPTTAVRSIPPIQIKTIEFHDFIPGGDKVIDKFLFCLVAGIDFCNCSQL